MNSFTKGLLTGVFGVVVGLVISGSNYQIGVSGVSQEVGRYQLSTTMDGDGYHIFETILDTRTGKVKSRDKYGCCPNTDDKGRIWESYYFHVGNKYPE